MLPIGQAIFQHQHLQEARMMTVSLPLAAKRAPLSRALPAACHQNARSRHLDVSPDHWQLQHEKASYVPEEDTPDICEIV